MLTRHTCAACGDVHVCATEDATPAPSRAEGPDGIIRAGRLEIDVARHSVTVDGRLIPLRAQEFNVLVALARADGRVLTRAYLLERAWPDDFVGCDRTVDVHVRRLRVALESIDLRMRAERIIVTVHAVGYRFAVPAELNVAAEAGEHCI